MPKILDWLKYYRASLVDGSRGEKNNIFPETIQRDSEKLSSLTEIEVTKIWDEDKIFKYNLPAKTPVETENDYSFDESEDYNSGEDHTLTEINKIEIAPLYITSTVEHGYKTADTKLHYPFWVPAYIDKLGNLYPPKEGELPLFIRNYLAPNPSDVPTIAEMEESDNKMSDRDFNDYSWNSYWEDSEHFFKEVTGKQFKDYQDTDYHQFTLSKLEESNTTRNILALYNELIFSKNADKQNYSLLNKVLDVDVEPKNHELNEVEIFLNANHFGQMSGEFPLSLSQRIAFAQFTSKYNKQAFAINGPPGTGKTTILQSFIANIVAKSVLEEKQTPLMAGCSTNNQAITNILDSMKLEETKDLLSNRWLPDVHSFGLYLASSSKKNEASKNYQIATTNYLNDGFIGELDDNFRVEEYENYFHQKLKKYFKIDIIEDDFDVNSFLFKKIKTLKSTIQKSLKIGLRKYEITNILKNKGFNSYEDLITEINNTNTKISESHSRQNDLKQTQQNLSERHKNLSFFIKLIPLKKFRNIRENAYKLVTQPFFDEYPTDFKWYKYSLVYSELEKLLFETINQEKELNLRLTDLMKLKEDIDSRNNIYENFISEWKNTYKEKWENLIGKTKDEYNNLEVLPDLAVKLDISYRNESFWLCVHFREWEYIQELKLKDSENKERGQSSYIEKLRRLAKITPLFISTFHTLPKFSTYYKYPEGNRFYKDLFDLMIVDESGQVSPEVAIPSLTFAKKILAVGDVYQIEPVWNVAKGVDYANAEKYNVITDEKDFESINDLGFTASNGNLMKLIKKATPFSFNHSNGETEKGAYLLEHRRCLNPIIEYSKDNVYKGSLKLMVGNEHHKNHDLPPLGYIHIDGSSEKHNGSSRKNIKEANAIVQWVINHKEELGTAYNKPLSEVLAIITPFSAQKIIIKQILKKHLDKNVIDKLIVGTVHALQGAERPIILFSTVHDTEDKMLFFNYQGKFNMLNVALTRAKHAFIVIGNMSILNPKDSSPSGKLGAKLFSKESYALNDTFVYQSDIVYKPNAIDRIDTLEQHIKTLEKCFKIAQKELIIFSPFISIKAIENDNVISLINEATNRDVKVSILTDKYLDKVRNKLKENSELGRNAIKNTKANLIVVNGIHNKTICVDDNLIIEGSFNWLSATRDTSSLYFRNEISVVIQGNKVKGDIEKIKESFKI